MPEVELSSWIAVLKHRHYSADHIARQLRIDSSIIVRIQKEEVLIDLRTVTASEEDTIINALNAI